MNIMTSNDYKQELIEKLRENYLSVALGILVLLVAVTLVFRSGDTNEQANNQEDTSMEQSEQTYTVQAGDSVSSIARDQLGSMDYADEIIAENGITDPNQIEIGDVLVLPNVDGAMEGESMEEESMENDDAMMEEESMEGEVMEDKAVTQTISIIGDTYTVQKGDHLWDIAERAYGDGNMYTTIIEANTLRNPDRLEEGTVLKLPRPNTK